MDRLLSTTLRHRVFVNILTVLILVLGAAAVFTMSREIFPEMSVDMILVNVIYRGADPEEVEEGVSRKLEEAIEGLEGVKTFYTYADEGAGTAVIECLESYDIAKLKENVRDRVDTIMDFPADTESPFVTEIVARSKVLSLTVSGEATEAELKEMAEQIKRELLLLPEISQVSVGGVREYELSIEVTEERLRQFGVTFDQVAAAVRAQSLNLPGGTVKTQREEITLRSMGRRYTAHDFSSIVTLAAPDGTLLPLGRIATVRETFEETPLRSDFNYRRAAHVHVFKTTEEDTISISDAVTEYLDGKALPPGVTLTHWSDTARLVRERIDLLVRNGILGFILVFAVLWLFLDLRLGFWVSLGIPISLGGGMAVMSVTGQTLNMLSLFALIMVLGIVVDDAIVVGEAIYAQRRQGVPPLKAAFNGVREMSLPVIAAVTTTIVAFCPLFFVSGIMGKFIAVVPVAVVAALLFSLFECLFLLPAHLNHLPDLQGQGGLSAIPVLGIPSRIRRGFSRSLERFARVAYGAAVRVLVRWRYVGLAGAVAVMLGSSGLLAGGLVKFTFFPRMDTDFITAKVEFPRGTPLEVTHGAVKQLEAGLQRAERHFEVKEGKNIVRRVSSITGAHSGYEMPSGSHLAEIQAELLPSAERSTEATAFFQRWREEVGEIPGAIAVNITTFTPMHMGKALEIWVLGNDMKEMRKASATLRKKLSGIQGVYNVEEDYRPGKREIRLRLRPEARTLGVTFLDVARQVRAAFYGSEAVRVQRGRDNLRVYLRYPLEGRADLSQLKSMRISTARGEKVPLESVADFSMAEGYARIVRENGLRRLVVTAEVDGSQQANASAILEDLKKEFLPGLEKDHAGILVSVEGQEKERKESMKSLGIGFGLAAFVIFLILATIFRSYIQPIIILTTVPFGFAGVVLSHFLLGYDLTMMSLFGLVALAGVVVNDAIIMIEAVNTRISEGLAFEEALVAGGIRRFRPVVLTTLTTFFGLLPLIAEQNFQAKILIPMALSISFGVAFATLLTLFLLPCQLGILNDVRRLFRWLWTGEVQSKEKVEPASARGEEERELFGSPTEVAAPSKTPPIGD